MREVGVIWRQNTNGHKYLSQAIECGQLVSSLLDRILVNFYIASPELPKFAEMLLENDVAFIAPYIIVNVENVVSLFSSPSTSSQKVRK